MSPEQMAQAALATVAVAAVVMLAYGGFQLRQVRALLQGRERQAAEARWSALRMAIITDPQVAELWARGLAGEPPRDAVEALRFERLMSETLWAAFHAWDGARHGPQRPGARADMSLLAPMIGDGQGAACWAGEKGHFHPEFVRALDGAVRVRTEAVAARTPRFDPTGGSGDRSRTF